MYYDMFFSQNEKHTRVPLLLHNFIYLFLNKRLRSKRILSNFILWLVCPDLGKNE